ncbi:MAG: hypothetical protein QME81_20100, partial [bacterium]|nr:hypothetical protein [bacterium]
PKLQRITNPKIFFLNTIFMTVLSIGRLERWGFGLDHRFGQWCYVMGIHLPESFKLSGRWEGDWPKQ